MINLVSPASQTIKMASFTATVAEWGGRLWQVIKIPFATISFCCVAKIALIAIAIFVLYIFFSQRGRAWLANLLVRPQPALVTSGGTRPPIPIPPLDIVKPLELSPKTALDVSSRLEGEQSILQINYDIARWLAKNKGLDLSLKVYETTINNESKRVLKIQTSLSDAELKEHLIPFLGFLRIFCLRFVNCENFNGELLENCSIIEALTVEQCPHFKGIALTRIPQEVSLLALRFLFGRCVWIACLRFLVACSSLALSSLSLSPAPPSLSSTTSGRTNARSEWCVGRFSAAFERWDQSRLYSPHCC